MILKQISSKQMRWGLVVAVCLSDSVDIWFHILQCNNRYIYLHITYQNVKTYYLPTTREPLYVQLHLVARFQVYIKIISMVTIMASGISNHATLPVCVKLITTHSHPTCRSGEALEFSLTFLPAPGDSEGTDPWGMLWLESSIEETIALRA